VSSSRGVLAGETGLAAVVAAARLVICGDTGVAHLATAFGTPSVVLFGPVAPSLWGPPADGPHTVLWHGDGTGSPWAEVPDPALLRITVEAVDEAVRERLGATRRGSSVTDRLASAR
jgi:ADP-heptose:LPS heptosyltransferase